MSPREPRIHFSKGSDTVTSAIEATGREIMVDVHQVV
jgi:hypothetical protein